MSHKNSPVQLYSMENPEILPNGGVPPGIKLKELTNDEQKAIVCGLLEESEDGRFKYGAISRTAKNYGVARQTISILPNKSVKARESGKHSLSVIHNKNAGMTNNLKYDLQALSDELKQLPHDRRQNIRDAAHSLEVLLTTIYNEENTVGVKRNVTNFNHSV